MARPWVKLHCRINHDPNICDLPPASAWRWCQMLALAGEVDEDGRLGSLKYVAHNIHCPAEDILAAIGDLDGRIGQDEAGDLFIRDWHEWQAPSRKAEEPAAVAARVARHRARPEHVTECNDALQNVTARNGPLDIEIDIEEEKEKDTPATPPVLTDPPPPPAPTPAPVATSSHPAGAMAAPDGATGEGEPSKQTVKGKTTKAERPPRKWAPLEALTSRLFGGIRIVDARTGEPLAFMGQLTGVVGDWAGGDVAKGCAMLEEFARSGDWQFATADQRLAGRFGKWAVKRYNRPGAHPPEKTPPADPAEIQRLREQIASTRIGRTAAR